VPPEARDFQEREIEVRKKFLFNELGPLGWNAFHYAIFCGFLDLTKFYMDL
jgi:hypothetical protein